MAKHGNDLNQWPTQLNKLTQDKTVPETGYERVTNVKRIEEEIAGEEEQNGKEKGKEEMERDMVCMSLMR